MFRATVIIFLFISSINIVVQILSYENISETSSPSSSSQVIFDKTGNLHVTWLDSTNQIYYRFREDDHTWHDKVLLYKTDSAKIMNLAITTHNDSVKIFWIEKEDNYKIKYIAPYDTEATLLYESENELQNIKLSGNSSNDLAIWFEKEPDFKIKCMDLIHKDTLTIGITYSQFSYSVSKNNSDMIFVFWLLQDNILFRSLDTTWSETTEIIIRGEAQPLNEMDCIYNDYNNKFCFVFTGDIPTCCGDNSTGLFYLEGNDTTWSAITSLKPPIQYCTNPQIEIYEGEYNIVLYQDGFNGKPLSDGSKFYYTQKYYDYSFSDTLFAPDSSVLNDFTSGGNRLYCSFEKNNNIFIGDIDIITPNVKRNKVDKNYTFTLEQNYPNPFGEAIPTGNSSTTIKYTIANVNAPALRNMTLKVYDILGREVATLVNEVQAPGNYKVQFNSLSASSGHDLPSGIYFYKLQSGSFIQSRKMILLK